MANLEQLRDNLVRVFEDGKQAENSEEVAAALALAIHDYVHTAQVSGVRVDVVDTAGNPIGSGTQSGSVNVD